MNDLFSDALQPLLEDHSGGDVIRAIEAGGSASSLWSRLQETGFTDALVPESAGGAGLGLADVYPLLELCGRYAVPVPFGETMLARGILATAGIPIPDGPIALAESAANQGGSIVCRNVPLGKLAEWIMASRDGECRLLAVSTAQKSEGLDSLDTTLAWEESTWRSASTVSLDCEMKVLQAALYAALLAGCLMSVFQRTLEYANERQQFGKPIGKFQAIQHQLSVMSEHSAAARMAARLSTLSSGMGLDPLRVAIAKARTSEAALEVAALSHSIHGAIGFTAEYDLQIFTRRLHQWRQTAGAESYWHQRIGLATLESSGLCLDLLRKVSDVESA